MAHDVECFLLIFLTLASYQMAASEDCALGAKSDKKSNRMGVNGRRSETKEPYTDHINPEIKFKFGITIPEGAHTYKGYTNSIPGKVYRVVTPPINFFPRGSSPVTVTILPWTNLYLDNKYPVEFFCEYMTKTCLRVHDTGPVCAKALHYSSTLTFDNYCAMTYANCKAFANIWDVAYFGNCQLAKIQDSGADYDIDGDNFWEEAVINIPPYNPITGLTGSLFKKK